MDSNNTQLNPHCQTLLEQFDSKKPLYDKLKEVILELLDGLIKENSLVVTATEARVKNRNSLIGKLALKGEKYESIDDITDLVGARVITFYTDEVDKIAALMEKVFTIDWANSVDKRKMHQLNSFGYNSLHYICSIPESLYSDPEYPGLNRIRFEIQMRTALQHVWSNIHHDTGYKSGIEIPSEYLRNLNRLAGMLELADEQFSLIRTGINEYRRKVQALVADGNLDEVLLDGDSFDSYLKIGPFDDLNRKIASLNQAEIHEDNLKPFLAAFKNMGLKTLGDIERLKSGYSKDAFKLAAHRIGTTDLDIISSTMAAISLCEVYILENGGGSAGLVSLYDTILGENRYNAQKANLIYSQAMKLPFMEKHRQ